MIHADVRAFIEGRSSASFEALALRLAAWQRAHNPAYGRLFGAAPTRLEEVPAVPVELFREVDLSTFPASERVATFLTSGTTGGGRGRHHFRDLGTYDLSARTWARACLGDWPRKVVSLCPTEPTSSLGHMVSLFGEVVPCFVEGAVDVPRALAALADGRSEPVFLAATAFALDVLLAEAVPCLDERSIVMVTGGFKGRRTRLDAPGLYAALTRLGCPRVVGEYGMTELSSQLWTALVPAGEVPGTFRAPPWLRPYTVDVATGAPTSGASGAGEGLLRFVDLANVDSVVAVETLDLGVVTGDRVELRGRLPGAALRGCSLSVEEGLG